MLTASSPPIRRVERAHPHVLMYHGLHAREGLTEDSFVDRRYSVSVDDFCMQMDAIAEDLRVTPSTCWDLVRSRHHGSSWAITFDDGIASALSAAEILQARGWRAHFFVVSGWIGSPGYLDADQIRELHLHGHVVGTHSVSHPDRMSCLSPGELTQEWRDSARALGEVLGEPVRVASVPGGSVSRDVIAAARRTGMAVLFTSEPVSRVRWYQGCAVVGRYAVHNECGAHTVAALAAGEPLACGSQWIGWNSRKAVKKAFGERYYPVRDWVVRSRPSAAYRRDRSGEGGS